jgi:hypothetical protein
MRRTFAVLAAVVLGLLGSAGQASASDPGISAEQAAAQAAASGQAALALAGGLQSNPTNSNTAINVLSPGNAGSVSQSNTVIAGSVAANGNSTNQTATQTQAGGSGTQAAGQIAGNDQSATSSADAEQLGAKNENIDVRVLSPGNGGNVSQSNTVLAGSLAANGNQTGQTASQTQAGGPGSGYGQTVGQAAANKQDAWADSTATQHGAKNKNISVRVLSPGDDGDVSQSNTVAGIAAALNGNGTSQTASQNQAGGPSGSGTQTALQGATSQQKAGSSADAKQHGASNENIAVRVLSPGNGGSVHQSNNVLAGSLALNLNHTSQSASQTQAGGYGGSNQQIAGQAATNYQDADAYADADQRGASNTNLPIRVLSEGDDGDVSQSNTVAGIAAALNGNETTQTASQTQAGGGAPMPVLAPESELYKRVPQDAGTGVQVVGQIAQSDQDADAVSTASQEHASNLNAPVRVGSPGDNGSVTQANTVLSLGIAANGNKTTQGATQNQAGSGGTLVQAVGQAALNKQDALACADAAQKGASNTNAPVRVFSEGDGGSTSQANTAAAIAAGLNGNSTGQSAGQSQAGGRGSTLVQASGQAADSKQSAAGLADADQYGVSNTSAPIRIGETLHKPKRCEPKQRCETKRPIEPCRRCAPRKPDRDACERPVEPPKCAPRKPVCDPCERERVPTPNWRYGETR